MWGVVVGGFLAAVLVLVGFANITTTIEVTGRGRSWAMAYTGQFLAWRSRYAWTVPMTPAQHVKPMTGFDPKKVHRGVKFLKVYSRFVRKLWDSTTVEKFSCVVHLGVNEASSTALLVGFLNNVIGPWVSLRIAPQCESWPEYGVYPLWDQMGLTAHIRATVRFRPVDMTKALIGTISDSLGFYKQRQQ
ncbi:MAG: hypothetical protein OWR62_01355 [Sulfobacillus thermotolerans]|nr:hypothetical protein [Sulfobacillus thermotolerans]